MYTNVMSVECGACVCHVSQTVCDGARQYADTVSCILEKKGYYDDSDNQQFDVTDQVLID